jgi:hypothetical protein
MTMPLAPTLQQVQNVRDVVNGLDRWRDTVTQGEPDWELFNYYLRRLLAFTIEVSPELDQHR